MKPKVVAMVNVDNKWINMEELTSESTKKLTAKTISQAAESIGYRISKGTRHKKE